MAPSSIMSKKSISWLNISDQDLLWPTTLDHTWCLFDPKYVCEISSPVRRFRSNSKFDHFILRKIFAKKVSIFLMSKHNTLMTKRCKMHRPKYYPTKYDELLIIKLLLFTGLSRPWHLQTTKGEISAEIKGRNLTVFWSGWSSWPAGCGYPWPDF